jgi:hypothetical protein
MDNFSEALFLTWLKVDCGYLDPKPLPRGRWAAIWKLMFTHAVVVGTIGDQNSIDDRWCYQNYEQAKTALDAWDGEGEPEGWHRHPITGRRRTESGEEYTAP